MKLRNKKTGEIVEPCGINLINGRAFVRFDDGKGTFKFEARSLADLNEEWEDYEEPKEYWYIDIDGGIMFDNVEDDTVKVMREIGNYFDTREEAEKAVENLKAFKRLKDKGFNFNGWEDCNGKINTIYFSIPENKWETDTCDDLDTCFGGE